MDQELPVMVAGLAVRTAVGGPMREISETELVEGQGLRGDVVSRGDRGVTFLSSRQWAEVVRELGVDLPWHTRRANILLDSAGLAPWLGRTIRLGEAVVRIIGETRPCELMDRFQAGLKAALTPDLRAGVHGRVLKGGWIRVGDRVEPFETA